MYFYLNFKPTENAALSVAVLPGEESLPLFPAANTLYLREGKQRLRSFDVPGGKFLLLGDPVFSSKEKPLGRIVPEAGKINQEVLFQEIKGHYNWFYLPETNFPKIDNFPKVLAGNSFGAVYPLYYAIEKERVVVGSSSLEVAEKTSADARDRRNLLERLLFNYPFFNSTWWENVRLLEAHRYLVLNKKGVAVEGDFEVSRYFGAPENTSRDSLPELAALFQKETELFFPDGEPFAISLTGGFDGRSLVAAAKKAGRNFFAYSFGRPDSTDVTMPATQAAKLRIPYSPIYLNENYVNNSSLDSAWALMQESEFNGNFGRPHYRFAAETLSKKASFILTGNFGSELFRALHLPGVMMSRHLINVFSAADDSWKDDIRQAAAAWGENLFEKEAESLIADLEGYLKKMQGWDANHKFYHFVFNEIFRKYFGAELVMQSHHLNNRTPFLNLRFFQELNRTHWSGVHARLFEKVKRRRMKGQMFYATFIRQADPQLYHLKTNKGYSPADVLESWRLPLLAGRVLWHKYVGNKEIDDNSVDAFIKKFHRPIAENLNADSLLFVKTALEKSLQEIPDGQNIEGWVKFYSIAAGWNAASFRGKTYQSSLSE
jgi:hypothetical protein